MTGGVQWHLWAQVVEHARAEAISAALMGDELSSGWGIRTLGAHEVAFNPVGYHTGSVWPRDTALIAAGLRIGDATVDLRFDRVRSGRPAVAVTEAHVDGRLDVVVDMAAAQPAAEERRREPRLRDLPPIA